MRAHAGAARRGRRARDRLHRGGDRQPLADRVAADGRDHATGSASTIPGAETRADRAARRSPTRATSAPPSRTASPTASSRSATSALFETWPLFHSNDERIDVRDLGVRRRVLHRPARGDCWDDRRHDHREAQAAARRHGAAQRPARPRADPLGGRRARRRGEVVVARPGASRACEAADGVPGVARRRAPGRGVRGDPAGQARAAARRKLPFENPSVLGVAAGASLLGAVMRRRVGGASGEAGRRDACRSPRPLFALRGGELAAYHGVEHKAIAAYESDAGGRRRRGQGARALRLPSGRRRCSPPTSPARCCCGAWSSKPGPMAGRGRRARVDGGRASRCSRGASATRRRRSRGACAARASSSSA